MEEKKLKVGSPPQVSLIAFIAIAVGIFATWIAVYYSHQPLLELQAFRQTQTALTSYWMIEEGWQLPYQTPVLGYPWPVPFEFPIYQSIVALISWMGGFPLDPVGRLVSFCFLLACAWPAFGIARRLALPRDTAWAFCALLWSSPLYLFYGRNFLMETAAVFFSLAAIPYALDLRDPHPRWRSALLFAFFASLAMLQKITTGAPVLLVLAAILGATTIKDRVPFLSARKVACLIVAMSIPLILGAWWTSYAGSIRALNYYGKITTFARQHEYYLGHFSDRFNLAKLKTIFWDRILVQNAAGLLGITLFTGAIIAGTSHVRTILVICIILFALPILLFFKVHLFIDYYQTASALFLIGALAIATTVWLREFGGLFAEGVLAVLIFSNLFQFYTGYGKYLQKTLDVSNSRTLAVSEVVRRYTPKESAILVYGLTTYESAWPVTSWSSEIVYYSQRKGFTVEDSFEKKVRHDPASFLGGKPLGAIVICDKNLEKYMPIIREYDNKPVASVFRVSTCYVWLPTTQSIQLPTSNHQAWPVDEPQVGEPATQPKRSP